MTGLDLDKAIAVLGAVLGVVAIVVGTLAGVLIERWERSYGKRESDEEAS